MMEFYSEIVCVEKQIIIREREKMCYHFKQSL